MDCSRGTVSYGCIYVHVFIGFIYFADTVIDYFIMYMVTEFMVMVYSVLYLSVMSPRLVMWKMSDLYGRTMHVF